MTYHWQAMIPRAGFWISKSAKRKLENITNALWSAVNRKAQFVKSQEAYQTATQKLIIR